MVLSLAACGAGGGQAPTARSLFHSDCAACHSLTSHAEASQQGGSLVHLSLSASEIRQFIAEMPQVHGPLATPQVQALTQLLIGLERPR